MGALKGPAPGSRGRLLVASSVRDFVGGLPGRLLGDSELKIRGGVNEIVNSGTGRQPD